jgi:abortive infection bacteriophage resistance protein
MATRYTKPHLTVAEQLELLRSRGLALDEPEHAARWLHMVGYYRLSGYWYPYRLINPDAPGRLDTFLAGTRFDHVTALYDFDRRLKLHVLDAIERIEITTRFRVGYTLGRRGAFAHLDQANLDAAFDAARTGKPASRYGEWRTRLASEQARSSEDFIEHFRARYDDELPVWVATEILDFGGLSVLYSGLKRVDRDEIAAGLNILDAAGAGNGRAFANWLQMLNYIRNTCAHHSRLWNRNLTVQLAPKHLGSILPLAHLRAAGPSATARLFSALCVLDFLMTGIDPSHEWTRGLNDLIATELPTSQRQPAEMGFPDNWAVHLH